jgi:uncharacterized repeat protein (TIGR03803 family)
MRGRSLFLLISGIIFSLFLSIEAETISVLHTFAPGVIQRLGLILTNSDGANPAPGLAISGATLYGAAKNGGETGSGTLFSVDTNGVNFKIVYTFSSNITGNSDGANPNGGLVLAGRALYGTTFGGGDGGSGVIFRLDTNNLAFSNIYSFSAADPNTGMNSDGANPSAGLVLSGATLFGTANAGGQGVGTLFSLTTNGTNFRVLHRFSALDPISGTNTDGANPSARLTLAGTTLFGTSSAGGADGNGTVFSIHTDGTGFTVLHSFDTNGASPIAELVLSGSTLYGMANSIVFSLNTNGTGFVIAHQFPSRIDSSSTAVPGLTLAGSNLYGAAVGDGANGTGQIFSLDINNNGFADQYDFTKRSGSFPGTNSDGAFPNGGLVFLNGTLYGTAGEGGAGGSGVLFSLIPSAITQVPQPVLSAQISGGDLLLSFPTAGGQNYFLEQNPDLGATHWNSYTNILGDGGLAQFTIPASQPKQFFRVRLQ